MYVYINQMQHIWNGHPWGAQNRAESKEPKTSEKLKHLSKNINLRNPTNSFFFA